MKSKYLIFTIAIFLIPISELIAGNGRMFTSDNPTEKFKRTYRTGQFQASKIPNSKKPNRLTYSKDKVAVNPLQNQQVEVMISDGDFTSHLSAGRDRNEQTIEAINPGDIPMDVQGDSGTEQVWNMPDFSNYAVEQVQIMATPLSTAPNAAAYPDATYAFQALNKFCHYYEKVVDGDGFGELRFLGSSNGTIDYFDDYVQSPIPLQLGLGTFGGGGNENFACTDTDEELCDVEPTADYFTLEQTYEEKATGTLHTPDGDIVAAIKLHHTEFIDLFDDNDTPEDETDDIFLGAYEDNYIVWYSKEGHYVIAALEEDAPWTGQTTFDYMEYQKLTDASLPVQWADFHAKLNKHHQVTLNWRTQAEQNNNHFLIERSVDGKQFSSIGKVEAAGTTTGLKDYHFTDIQPESGPNYYRIQQVDEAGKTSTSSMVSVLLSASSEGAPVVVLYPNPGKDEVFFSQAADYELFDAQGRLLTAGQADGALDVSGLGVGLYFVKINGGEMVRWMKQ